MRPVTYALNLYRDADYRRTVRLLDKDGEPFSTVGARSRLQVRCDPDDPVVLLDASDDNGLLSTAADGAINIRFTAAVTGALQFDEAVYDLKLTWADGGVDPVLKGPVRVEPSVTRPDEVPAP